ncbi:MAG: S-methyl-5-thioribose-1-phosphate isomerase [Chloroflexi bacterium]|nr:S-methyl-5-thioribose-1-phosphate isomerase [Chloroflexota bacterium]
MRTVMWEAEGPAVRMIDQRLLPGEVVRIDLRTVEEVSEAIRDMAVRGAPAIGATAAFGLALAAAVSEATDSDSMWNDLDSASATLSASRPTASNLVWALQRLRSRAVAAVDQSPQAIRQLLLEEAQRIADEDVETNKAMGRFGAELIGDSDTVIHHCNTGALATVDYGTALGVIRTAHEQGKRVHVLVDETRPRLQGAKLTAWELDRYGVPHEIISDNAAGYFLSRGQVAACFVGADRVAANGDVANKIGTYMLALAAWDNEVPFYVVLPTSTVDLSLSSGAEIPIEERDPREVLDLEHEGRPVAPADSKALNPAFDITPHRLISAFVTEVGVLRSPYADALAGAVRRAQEKIEAAH